jgi:hypothetical protein
MMTGTSDGTVPSGAADFQIKAGLHNHPYSAVPE